MISEIFLCSVEETVYSGNHTELCKLKTLEKIEEEKKFIALKSIIKNDLYIIFYR
jgi:hypothetical protein